MLKLVSFLIIILIWPLSLWLHNTPQDILLYGSPAILVGLSYGLYLQGYRWWSVALLPIGVINPDLSFVGPIVFLLQIFFEKEKKFPLIFFILSTLPCVYFYKKFLGHLIFIPEYNATQMILRNTYLYPNVWMARLFQNKLSISWDLMKSNFFALDDPNNYFFNFHPREIPVDNQNLVKFPFLSIIFLGFGLYNWKEYIKHYKWIAYLSVASILNLSILKNFDRTDFVLYPIFLIILWKGLSKVKTLWLIGFILISLIEIIYNVL